MKIRYVGHSCFLLTTSKGVRILTDPYQHGAYDGDVRYRPITDTADVVLVSHSHPDHSYAAGVGGRPSVFKDAGSHFSKGINFLGVPMWHDASRGAQRGSVVAFRFEADGIAVAHLGDLGHTPDGAAAAKLRPIDILFMPVGGYFTIGAPEAQAVLDALSPRLVIPMHYKTAGVDFSIETVDPFLKGRKGVRRESVSEVTVEAGAVPVGVLVLTPANLP